jgi:hypothetical protein
MRGARVDARVALFKPLSAAVARKRFAHSQGEWLQPR